MPKTSRKSRKRHGTASKKIRRVRRTRRSSKMRVGRSLHGFTIHNFKDRNPFGYPYTATTSSTTNDTWPTLATLPATATGVNQLSTQDVLMAFLPSLQESTVYNQARPMYQFVRLNKVVVKFKALMQASSTGNAVLQSGYAIHGTTTSFTPNNFPNGSSTSSVFPTQFRTMSGLIDLPGLKAHKLGSSFSVVILPKLSQVFDGQEQISGASSPNAQWVKTRKMEITSTLGSTPDKVRYGGAIVCFQQGTANGLQAWDLETTYYFSMINPY